MKRILLAIALVAAATPVVQAYHQEAEEAVREENGCGRCRRQRCNRCRTCRGSWRPFFRGNCERCNAGCNRNA